MIGEMHNTIKLRIKTIEKEIPGMDAVVSVVPCHDGLRQKKAGRACR